MNRLIILAVFSLILILESPMTWAGKENDKLLTCVVNHAKQETGDEEIAEYEEEPYDDPKTLQAPTKACCKEFKFPCEEVDDHTYYCIAPFSGANYMQLVEKMGKCCDKNMKGTKGRLDHGSSAWKFSPCK